jgi:hypothetical protein
MWEAMELKLGTDLSQNCVATVDGIGLFVDPRCIPNGAGLDTGARASERRLIIFG